ncbi:hypothetical protein E3N88_01411 [Mikania micrantha]|uniref:Serine-threonine/tyrosine-protein kinase catalytic domain-containing protein n=1 Tax=Mikania micrantha TaxID=192012 RepID=A0A5N6Q0W2_9ASTR|nr:hypothetical protein E3N88_01411 [Mikania micrantha]
MHRVRFSRYFDTNTLTPKYDVYSFGVLMLEVLCGRKPKITNEGVEEDIDEVIDPHLKKQMDTLSLTLFSSIAYNCLNHEHVQRPTMDQIIKELEEEEHSKAADEGSSSSSLKIPLREIRRATNGFNKKCLVGSGGFAHVYKAKLQFLVTESVSSIEGKSKDEVPKEETTVLSRFRLSDIELATENFVETCCIGLDTNGIVYKAEVNHYGYNKRISVAVKRIIDGTVFINENKNGLAPIALQCFNDGTIERIIDPRLMEEMGEDVFTSNRSGPKKDSLEAFLKLACQCLGETVKRPTIEMAIMELEASITLSREKEERTNCVARMTHETKANKNDMCSKASKKGPCDKNRQENLMRQKQARKTCVIEVGKKDKCQSKAKKRQASNFIITKNRKS